MENQEERNYQKEKQNCENKHKCETKASHIEIHFGINYNSNYKYQGYYSISDNKNIIKVWFFWIYLEI